MAKIFTESFRVKGEELLGKVKELIQEGNVRKVTILNSEGKEVMSFPVTIGVVGVLLAPVFAAIGAMAAIIGDCTIKIEREQADTK